MDRLRRDFFWGRAGSTKGVSLLNWPTVTLPKQCGGMGVRDLESQNISLMLRWWWQLYEYPDSLWGKFAIQLRNQGTSAGPLIWIKQGSFFWGQLMGIKRLFHWSSNVIIGEGSSISFWYDSWNGSPILSQLDPTPRPPHFKISLREAVHRDLHLPTTHAGVTVNAEVTFNDDSDRIIWRWGSGGKYSSKSVYEVMIRGGKEVWPFPEVWCCKAPLKARVFAYLLLLEKVLTHEVMISRNMHCDPSCVQCDLEVLESAYHLFFECPYAVQVWQEIHRHLGVVKLIRRGVVRDTWKASWEYTRATKTLTIKSWATYFICVCWGIWKQRNNRIFCDSALNPRIVAESVVQEGLLWLRNC